MKASIIITLKKSLFDAQGATVQKALHHLGYTNVKDLRIGKFITIELDGDDPAALRAQVEEMCQKLLANPIIEEFRVEVDGQPVTAVEEMKVASPPRKNKKRGSLRDTAPVMSRAFQVSREELTHLSPTEDIRLLQEVWEENGDWIDEQLELRGATWLLIVGGRIVGAYQSDKDWPSDEEVRALEQREGKAAWFLGRRPDLIEEASAWTPLPEDAYPTLAVLVAHPQWDEAEAAQRGVSLIADFDTGNPFVFFDYSDLRRQGIISARDVRGGYQSEHLHEPFIVNVATVAMWVRDARGQRHRLTRLCDCVLNWERSPFRLINPQRQALVGRPLLLGFPLTVELDGEKKQTKVKRVGKRKK
ncbi:MAG: phosphoribosylformylglycinamidine synthase subunit PurS [Abditibacteriales bacterium]|nr:phosphoribosylformylglycinamidine synthase subunit PurS [Abditibacteriales bacterium]MDW8365124.1 phosphoribosylformylglycinamidine synthase subunit PurS [Abditibacteriales bacterium]